MSELKDHGEITGIDLLLHYMSNWRSQLEIEYKRWRKQDEQAYQQIVALVKKSVNTPDYLESTSDPPESGQK